MDNRPIGIMDSGVGGLTVARYLKKKYPDEGIVFIGDTAHNPYGDKTKEEITTLIQDFLPDLPAEITAKQLSDDYLHCYECDRWYAGNGI